MKKTISLLVDEHARHGWNLCICRLGSGRHGRPHAKIRRRSAIDHVDPRQRHPGRSAERCKMHRRSAKLLKGGFIFGGKHGRGVASCRTAEGWSAPAFVSIGGGSWGLQIGVEGVDLVMLVMNDRGLQHLLSTKFELTGEGSVAAGPVGRHTSAGTDILLNTEVLTYSRSKGVFAGLTLEGAVIEQDNDSTRAIYGHHMMFRNILSGKASTPASGDAFVRAVSEAGHQAHVAEAREDSK
jgi:lipid-binding SYLF domain-containing protein